VIPGKRTPGRQPRDTVDWSYDPASISSIGRTTSTCRDPGGSTEHCAGVEVTDAKGGAARTDERLARTRAARAAIAGAARFGDISPG
jgi:hypothetical protein